MTKLHNEWMVEMINGTEDMTLQAHRGSYKTTCVSIVLAILMVLYPNIKLCFIRSNEKGTREIIKQTANVLQSELVSLIVRELYGIDLVVDATAYTINTNLPDDPRGTWQLVGRGAGGSITGQHYDRIFTDDIVTLNDRISESAREATKQFYQELQNIKNRGGRIINTGTPWHRNDCFTLMPNIVKYDVYTTGLLSKEEIKTLRDSMAHSLFAANYELRHVAAEDALFVDPVTGGDPALVQNGIAHVDSAFYGEDYTAFTMMCKHDDKYYVLGKLWRRHVEDCYPEINELYEKNLATKLYNETNADKGMVAKEMRQMGLRVVTYSESMNKHVKIATYLYRIWKDIIFVEGTDDEYINQICDYTEDAEHDDAPDSCACCARLFAKKSDEKYIPLWN